MRHPRRYLILFATIAVGGIAVASWMSLREPAGPLLSPGFAASAPDSEPSHRKQIGQLPDPALPESEVPQLPNEWIERGSGAADFFVSDSEGYAVPPRFIDEINLWRRTGERWVACTAYYDDRTWAVKCGYVSWRDSRTFLEPGEYLLHVRTKGGGEVAHSFVLQRGEALQDALRLKHSIRVVELRLTDADGHKVQFLASEPRPDLDRLDEPPGAPKEVLSGSARRESARDWSYLDDWRLSRIQTHDGSYHVGLPKGIAAGVRIGYVDAEDKPHEILVSVPAATKTVEVRLPLATKLTDSWKAGKGRLHEWVNGRTGERGVRLPLLLTHETRHGQYRPPPTYGRDPAVLTDLAPGKTRAIFVLSELEGLRPEVEILNADGST